MRNYECEICGDICDPGELRNGVCDDCREKKEQQKSWTYLLNQMVHAKEYKQMNVEDYLR